MGCLGGCFSRVVGLLVVVVLAAAVWLYRDRILDAWRAFEGAPAVVATQVSPALADRAARELAGLKPHHPARRVALGQAEIQSLADYRMQAKLPVYARHAHFRLRAGRMFVETRVPTRRIPRLSGLGPILHLLPDTTRLAATVEVLPLNSGHVALAFDDLTAERIPIPRRFIPALLRHAGRSNEPGLPSDALAFRLPAGACSAYIHGDSLVLVGSDSRTGCH